MNKTMLLLTYYFPPQKNGGVARPYSIFKYLPRHDINVHAITAGDQIEDMDHDKVTRVSSFADFRNSGCFSKKYFCRIASEVATRITGCAVYDFLWKERAYQTALELIRTKKINAIYATFPPIDTLSIGIRLSKQYGIPLIVEFRDGLLYEPVKSLTCLQKKSFAQIEILAMMTASAVITIGNRLTEDLLARYPKANIYTIRNGYELDDFNFPNDYKKQLNMKKVIINFGSINLTKKRNLKPLCDGLAISLARGVISSNNFELSLIGQYSSEEKRCFSQGNLKQVVKFYPPMNKKDGFIKISNEADYLLFYGVPNEKSVISSKVYEYIMLNKPIIGICQGNEAGEIISETGTGVICDFDANQVADTIEAAMRHDISYSPNRSMIESYDRSKQAEKIGSIISSVIG